MFALDVVIDNQKKNKTFEAKNKLMSNNKKEKAEGLFDVATRKAYSPLAEFPCDKTYEELLQDDVNIYNGGVGHFDWYLFPCHCRRTASLNFDIDEDEQMTKFFLKFSDCLWNYNNNIDRKYLSTPIPEEYKTDFVKEEENNDASEAPDIRFAVCKKAVDQWYPAGGDRNIRFCKIIQHIDFTLRSLIYLSQTAENKDMIEAPLKHCLIFVKTHIIDPHKNDFEKEVDGNLGNNNTYSLHDVNYKTNVSNLLKLFSYLDLERSKDKNNFDWVATAVNYMNQSGNASFKPGFLKDTKDENVNNSVPKFTVSKSSDGSVIYKPEGFSVPGPGSDPVPGPGSGPGPDPIGSGGILKPKETSSLKLTDTPLSSRNSQQDNNKKQQRKKNQLGLVVSLFFAVVVVAVLAVVGAVQLRGNKSSTKEINNEVKDNLQDGTSLYV